jgi:hypothetical protein
MTAPTLSKRSIEELGTKFQHLVPKGWNFAPVLVSSPPVREGHTQEFTLAGAGEDERVMALRFKAGHEEAVVLIAANPQKAGRSKHCKFLTFWKRTDRSWWDPNFSITLCNPAKNS